MKIINGKRFYDLMLSEETLQYINDGLMLVPYYRAVVAIKEINDQLKPPAVEENTKSET